eukprot:1921567-Amphidinium_carterae.1
MTIADKVGLLHVVHFFQRQRLLTTKQHDFLQWSHCVEIYCRGEHLEKSGRKRISQARACINLSRPTHVPCGLQARGVPTQDVADWICGFVSGEGSFNMNRKRLRLQFSVGQRTDSGAVIDWMQSVMHVGTVYEHFISGCPYKYLAVCKTADIRQLRLFFSNSQLIGSKQADFEIWCRVFDATEHA